MEKPVTIGDAARQLGVSAARLREWCNRRSGNCPYIPWGKQKRVLVSEVEEWLRREQVKR